MPLVSDDGCRSPNTGWLDGCLALDGKGFIITGRDLDATALQTAQWPLKRTPQLLETSLPGVFAVGDIRSANVKRVAAAVGEGSTALCTWCTECWLSFSKLLEKSFPLAYGKKGGEEADPSLSPLTAAV